MKKKVICTIMILMLFITPCYEAYADAGTIAITGGSIAVGGAGTIATGAIAGPVVIAVFCGMMAMGMNVSLTNASQEAGMTKTQYLKSKLEQYCHEAQVTYGVFNNAILNGTTVLQNGAIKLGSQAGTQIKQFCNWLWDSNQVLDQSQSGSGGSGTSDNTVTLGNYNVPCVSQWSYVESNDYVRNRTSNYPVALVVYDNNSTYAYINRTPGTVVSNYGGDGNVYGTNTLSSGVNGYYYYAERRSGGILGLGEYGTSNIYNNAVISINGSIIDFLNSLDGSFNITGENAATDTFTGSRDAWSSGSNALDPTQGKSTVINPGLTGSIPIPADTDITVNVRDYLDALEKVLDGIQAGIVARDKETDIPITIPIPDETVIDPTIDKEDDEDLPDQADQTPVTDPDKPVDPEQNPSTAVEPLKFDLKNIFPFCIPFDIKDMLAKLSAEPVAPNYHVDWNIPLLNTSLEFDINLSCWNSVAAILRKMELLSFIVGLAVLTRNLIRG